MNSGRNSIYLTFRGFHEFPAQYFDALKCIFLIRPHSPPVFFKGFVVLFIKRFFNKLSLSTTKNIFFSPLRYNFVKQIGRFATGFVQEYINNKLSASCRLSKNAFWAYTAKNTAHHYIVDPHPTLGINIGQEPEVPHEAEEMEQMS